MAIEDLLNRPQVPLDREGMARLVQGRRVMVTGAGGTIGSELARQVAALGPERLILLDNGEYALWQIDLELAERHPHVPRRALLADIRDEVRVRAVFEELRPELVFHAAALKHVPMVEANPLEGLLTNVAGTRQVADAARAAGARAMVLISTDKAVNPTSVMGATQAPGRDVLPGAGHRRARSGRGMRCVTVRFGNVLGSTGSVVPLFQRQLERGGPLTVTHPDMQRYFMTVREAVGLVLQASVVGTGDAALPSGEEGGIFVLDMGEPVKIVDLARQMIRLAGLAAGARTWKSASPACGPARSCTRSCSTARNRRCRPVSRPADGDAAHRRPGDRRPRHRRDRRGLPRRPGAAGAGAAGPAGAGVRAQCRRTDARG